MVAVTPVSKILALELKFGTPTHPTFRPQQDRPSHEQTLEHCQSKEQNHDSVYSAVPLFAVLSVGST
jgi:hypothetical protein